MIAEVREAIDELKPTLEEIVENEISEVEDAISKLKKDETIDDALIQEEDIETVKPVIEQDIEPDSYNHADYDVEAYSGTDKYKTHYKSAEVQIKESNASYAYVAKESKLMKEGQRIQQEAKLNNLLGKQKAESYIDTRAKEVKDDIKLRSMGMWYLMYEGVEFN